MAEPEISRIGQDSIRVGLPNVENAEQAINQVGQTAQLYLYDWEPNAIGNPAKTNVPRGVCTTATTTRSNRSQQQPECFEDECTTSGPSLPVQLQTKEWIAGPAEDEADLLAQANVPDGGRRTPRSSPSPRGRSW